MLPKKRSKLTMEVLTKLRNQGMPKKVGLISDMGTEDIEEQESEEGIVQAKSGLLSKRKKKTPEEA